MAEQQIYHGLVELQQHLRLFFSSRYHWPSASILVSGIDRWVIAMWCHWLLPLHGLYQPAPIAVWAKCHKNSLSYVVFVFVFAILYFSTAIKGTLCIWIYSTGTSTFNSWDSFSNTQCLYISNQVFRMMTLFRWKFLFHFQTHCIVLGLFVCS